MRHRLVLHNTGAALLALVSSTNKSYNCQCFIFPAAAAAFTPAFPNNHTKKSQRFMSSSSSSSSSRIMFQHYDIIESTQDMAKQILQSHSSSLSGMVNPGGEDDQNNRDSSPHKATTTTISSRERTLFAITAQEQTKGRGTSGRIWMGYRGNVFLTMALPMSQIPISPITLFPLEIGVLVAQRVHQFIQTNQENCRSRNRHQDGDSDTSDGPTTTTKSLNKDDVDDSDDSDRVALVRVKWPNDVLVNDEKVAGILIESFVVDDTVWLLVGVGVNLVAAPTVPTEGPNRGRTATSIQSYFCRSHPIPPSSSNGADKQTEETTTKITEAAIADDAESSSMSSFVVPESTTTTTAAQVFAQDLAEGLVQWLDDPTTSSRKVQEEWKSWANFGQVQLIRETNEKVIPIDLKEDGQLVVLDQDGNERLLVADYLF